MKFKRVHLLQQVEERKAQEMLKLRARDDLTGRQPNLLYLCADGMTVMRGDSPKVGGGYYRRGKKDNQFITNRVVAVEVVCGPIDTIFLYHTDNLVAGGANTMIQIIRQAISDVTKELHNIGLEKPMELALQFDNCGENKNK